MSSVLARKIEYLNIAIYCVIILYAGEQNVTIKTSRKVLKMPIICKIARETPLLVGGSYTGISPITGPRVVDHDIPILTFFSFHTWINLIGPTVLEEKFCKTFSYMKWTSVHAPHHVCTLVFGLHVLFKGHCSSTSLTNFIY